jgi:flagellar assembly factor FliW
MNSLPGTTLDRLAALGLLHKEIFFPAGLLGFPAYQRYKLEPFEPGDGSDSPFLLLGAGGNEVTFPVIHPASMGLDCHFPVNADLLSGLDAHGPEDLVPLLIVTLRERLEEITVNLQGPLIVNPVSSLGVQLVLEDRPLRHPLIKISAP